MSDIKSVAARANNLGAIFEAPVINFENTDVADFAILSDDFSIPDINEVIKSTAESVSFGAKSVT